MRSTRSQSNSFRCHTLVGSAAALCLAAACSSDPSGLPAVDGAAYTVRVGQTLDLRLQNIGPGTYASPPDLSSTAIRFVDSKTVGPFVPAGVTQLFTFQGIQRGKALVSFHQSATGATIVDTVTVE